MLCLTSLAEPSNAQLFGSAGQNLLVRQNLLHKTAAVWPLNYGRVITLNFTVEKTLGSSPVQTLKKRSSDDEFRRESAPGFDSTAEQWETREFKQLLRRRQRERHKTTGFNAWEKQWPCTCVINFGTFLCRPRQNNNVKWPHLRFYAERERTTVNFLFSVLTWTPFLPDLFLNCSALLYKLNELV